LSVLNHLGRNLYRSFITVLGEAISNSWDADAKNVRLYINKNSFVIKDDGNGMNEKDFQSKFLKIGYSKRKDGEIKSEGGRPYIGRKGIGKLALLSCAENISIISKTKNTDYTGGKINNSDLDKAIDNDLIPKEYPLEIIDDSKFITYKKNHQHGTIILFEELNEGINKSIKNIRKSIALNFRFSLLDDGFNIYLDDEPISLNDLDDLFDSTQFLWILNENHDPLTELKLNNIDPKFKKTIQKELHITGFIASVIKPSCLKIDGNDEKVTVDLFVNGRLREKDILKHIPSTRVVESYLYGQIHFDELDDEVDRFASSREGIIANDLKFSSLLEELRTILYEILDDWDHWRREAKQDGDPENKSISPKERKSTELFNIVAEEFIPKKEEANRDKVDEWVQDLRDDAQFNFSSYAECFISENLVRRYIKEQKICLNDIAEREYKDRLRSEQGNKEKGNISIDIRQNNDELSYLSLESLTKLVDNVNPANSAGLSRDAREYKPIRDALAHTALLTNPAKIKLSSVFENIKSRIKYLLTR
jgi:hypothetical protein